MSSGGRGKRQDHNGKNGEPHIDFENISKEIAKIDEKQHINQLGPAITEVYVKHAKYTDAKGVVRYKEKFKREEAEKLATDIYDALAYHSHRRVFGMDEAHYESLKKFKDANGKSYIDVVTQYHFNLDRDSLKESLAQDEDENVITHMGLAKMLEKPIQHHKGLLVQGVISKDGLHDPKHMDAVKTAIDAIVEKYKLDKKVFNTKKMYTPQDVLKAYVGLSQEHYAEGAHKKEEGG